jgi:hypothetical protein
MKKFYKTTLTIEIVSPDQPMDESWLSEFTESIRENSEDMVATGSIKATKVISGKMAAQFVEKHGFDEDLEDRFGIDEKGKELPEEEEEDFEDDVEEEEEEEGEEESCFSEGEASAPPADSGVSYEELNEEPMPESLNPEQDAKDVPEY